MQATSSSTCPFDSSGFSDHSCLFKQLWQNVKAKVVCWHLRQGDRNTTCLNVTHWMRAKSKKKKKCYITWIQMSLKKHLWKRMLRYFSSTAIGPTMSLSMTHCLEHVILQEIHACECKAKAASSSEVEVRLLWRIPLSLLAASSVQFVLQTF